MAVRFDAATEIYTRTGGVGGSVTAVSVACWAKISVNRGDFTSIWCVDNGSNLQMLTLITNSLGTQLTLATNTDGVNLRTLTVGVWYYLGAAIDASGVMLVSRAVNDTSFTVETSATSSNFANVAATTFRIGDDGWTQEWLNGAVSGVRWWSAKLTQQELENECWRHMPARTANLRGWYPLLQPDTADFSGNGFTLAGGSGATVEDGPPVSWGPRNTTIVLPASASVVSGTLDATLPSLTASVSGAVKAAGQVAATLPSLAAASTATATVQAVAAATLPALTANLTGTVQAPGLLAAVLPPLSASLTGGVSGGYLTATLPALAAGLAGAATATGTTAAMLPHLTAVLEGVVEIPPHDITVTSSGLQRGWSASGPDNVWDDDEPLARSWSSSPSERTWTADRADRVWTASPPT